MSKQDLYAQNEKMIRETWFPNHKATFEEAAGSTTGPQLKIITWKAPGTSTYWCRFIIDGRVLIVHGDIGDAVYGWSDLLTWEFLAGLDLGYFASKCQGSELGRGYEAWSPEVARTQLLEEFKQYPDELQKWNDVHGSFDEDLISQEQWVQFLHENGYDVFGDDLSSISKIGEVIDIRCQAHLIGIKLALAQWQLKYPQGSE